MQRTTSAFVRNWQSQVKSLRPLSTAVQGELLNVEIVVCRLLVDRWSRCEHGPSSKSPREQKAFAESGYKRHRESKMRVSPFTAEVSSFAQTPQV
jgi:hypothetical protein